MVEDCRRFNRRFDIHEGRPLRARSLALGQPVTRRTSLMTTLEFAPRAPETEALGLGREECREPIQPFGALNGTRVEFPREKRVHQFIEEQVQRTPNATALIFGKERLTYRELNERADALAATLQQLGIGPDVPVGVCLDRSLEMMVGLLGILKAGGCYVPLDPAFPRDRLAFMLADARPSVLLTQTALRKNLRFEIPSLKVLCVDERDHASRITHHEPANTGQGTHNPNLTSAHLAYIVYTSGSTGKPKGVMITHRNLANLFAGMDRVLGVAPGVWLAVTSISFDISVLELFWTLARGFTVVIHSEGAHQESIAAQILQHGVTHFQCTPSVAGNLVRAPGSSEALRQLGTFLVGGEALPSALATQLRQALRGELHNMYGPTETTVWSATHLVREVNGTVPIGRPIANTEIHILDEELRPLAAGEAGEIFIGGEGVARGYLNRPELTAERFVADPFSTDAARWSHDQTGRQPDSTQRSQRFSQRVAEEELSLRTSAATSASSALKSSSPGARIFGESTTEARLYRTGDIGRFRSDGTIEFLGRADHQVKLHGHRIELGEIESVLRQHPAVQECVVHVWEAGPDDKRLAAHIVPVNGAAPSVMELRRFLELKLPSQMIPAAFVWLEKMPLTPNGKIDRNALPKPNEVRPLLEAAYAPPQTQIETTIASVWRQTLRLEQVGVHDNFFDLGGNSLLLTETHAKLCVALKVEFPIMRSFEYPTIAALTAFLAFGRKTSLPNVHERAARQRAAFARPPLQAVTV